MNVIINDFARTDKSEKRFLEILKFNFRHVHQ